jgi:hypothetical protein
VAIPIRAKIRPALAPAAQHDLRIAAGNSQPHAGHAPAREQLLQRLSPLAPGSGEQSLRSQQQDVDDVQPGGVVCPRHLGVQHER